MTVLSAALKFLEMNISVIPVNPKNKKPYISWAEFQKRRASAEEVRKWWGEYPRAMIGAVTGKLSNLSIMDADNAAAYRKLADLDPNFNGPIARTPRPGTHNWYQHEEGLTVGSDIGIKGLDLRCEGGYAICPPSINGDMKPYIWVKGHSIFDVPPPLMPQQLCSYIKKNSIIYRGANMGANSNANNRQQPPTFANISFEEGSRDNTLFHLANCLVKGGMHIEEIEQLLSLIGSKLCNPPFALKEIQLKIQSAIKRSECRDRNLTQEIRELVMTTSGNIMTTYVYNCLQLPTRREKKKAQVALLRLEKDGLIEKTGRVAGEYRRIESECETIDWANADDSAFEIKWPFRVEEKALLYPKNIGVIAGTQNAGKTALVLNLAYMNRNHSKVRYFSSEMGEHELKGRLAKFKYPIDDWKAIDFRERSQNFADVILPDGLNIIDYYEISKDFWRIAEDLKNVYEKLSKGIAIVCLQKSEGKDAGRGGDFGLEKPRLYLNVDQAPPDGAVLTIRKGKAWAKEGFNPNWYKVRFNIINGCQLVQKGNWYLETK